MAVVEVIRADITDEERQKIFDEVCFLAGLMVNEIRARESKKPNQ